MNQAIGLEYKQINESMLSRGSKTVKLNFAPNSLKIVVF
jgi:hypothetical protein